MTRLITLGFENPNEILLGADSSDYWKTILNYKSSTPGIEDLVSPCVLAMRGNNTGWYYYWSSEETEIYFVGTFRMPLIQDNFRLLEFTNENTDTFINSLRIKLRSTGALDICRDDFVLVSSATSIIAVNTVYTIEVYYKPANSGGVVTVKVDGVEVATYTGDTTNDQQYTRGMFIRCPYNNVDYYGWWDNIAVNNSSGSDNNTWIGRMFLQPLYPRAAGDETGLSRGGTDLGANFAQVAYADEGLSFLQGDEDDYDLYEIDNVDLPTGATINNIIVEVTGKSTGGTGEIAVMIKADAVEDQGDDVTLTADTTTRQQVWAENPDTETSWAEADLATLQIGAKIRS
jgi:hypothetical protein